MEKNGKTYALITGASKGIGRAIARELAARKHNLILHSLPDEGLPDFCREIEAAYNIHTHHYEVDLIIENGPLALFELVKSKGCSVDILVNNAGISYGGNIEEYTAKQIVDIILINIRALTHLTYYFIPGLKIQKDAYILFLSSFGSYFPIAYKSVYLATKSYIFYLSRALGSELKDTPVSTCVIVPSAVNTNKSTLERISRSRFSRTSALSPEEVAATGIKGMFSGKKIIIPGTLTNLFFSCAMFLPEGILFMLTRRLFSKIR